ncbi:MAG: hypothetical protein J6S85_17175 [Methanobrevibacter sp.]|nr:hypothetical protein [Methanobrevibacter sp.]
MKLSPKEVYYIVHEGHYQGLDYVFLTRAYKKCKEWFAKEGVKESLNNTLEIENYIKSLIAMVKLEMEDSEVGAGKKYSQFLTDMVIKFCYKGEIKDV